MIHAYRQGGLCIVLDIESGAVHLLDDVAFDLLTTAGEDELRSGKLSDKTLAEMLEKNYPADECERSAGELRELIDAGLLYSEPEKIDPALYAKRDAPIKAICLHVSHDCNLRCKYCFASTGDFGTHKRMIMTPEMGRKAVDYVIAHSGKRRHIEIDFFGGEPLMSFDTCKAVVQYAREKEKEAGKEFRFTITTNGVLLDDEIDKYINENMSNAVLSIDGRKEVNDRLRCRVDGTGSYDSIAPKLLKLGKEREALGKDYYARGTYTGYNTDFAEDVLHLADMGFKQISVEPVVADPKDPYALHESDLPKLCSEYDKLAEVMRKGEKRFNFFHFNVDLEQGPCIIKRLRGCGAGSEYVAVTPDGDIYPCHQFVGKEEYKLGNICDDTFDREISNKFAAQNVYTRKKCGECWAKFYCSGGCSASNLFANGDISDPYELGCELERKRLECAIYLKCARALEAEE